MKKVKITLRRRPSKMVSIRVPKDTLEHLKLIAAQKELGYQSLLKLYIGEGLRRDLAEISRDKIVAKTVAVVRKHIMNEKKIAAIERSLKKITP
jgi:hypothetical protein